MSGYLNKFKTFSFDILMVLLVALTFLKYSNQMGNIYYVILVVISLILILFKANIFHLMPVALVTQMSFSDMRDNRDLTIVYGSIVMILLIIDILKNRKINKVGYLTLPLGLLSITAVITMINGISVYSNLVGFFQIFSVLLIYMYFLNTIDRKISYQILGKMFMYLSILVALESIHFVINSDIEIIEIIRMRRLDLGWENLNIIIYVNLLTIPLIAYLITNTKWKLPYMIASVFVIIPIMMTLSRSSIISVAIYIVLLIPLIIILDKHKIQLVIQGLLFVLILTMGLYYLEKDQIVSEYLKTLLDRDFDDFTGRIELIEIAWINFKVHPIIGTGGLFSTRYLISDAGYSSINYHNTIAQTMTLGTLGLLSFAFLLFRKVRLLFKSSDNIKWFILILLIVTIFVNGMVQPMYYYTSYMMFLFLILAMIEVKTIKTDTV